MACPYPYRAVTVCGAPFQALPVRKAMATGLIRVRSPLLAESRLLSFPPATEMFQFAGFASSSYGFTRRYRLKRWVAPFGDPRITGRSPLPSAFRSVPRPSSPLGAKASTRCPSCAALAPSPEHAASPRAEVRCQRSDVMATRPATRPTLGFRPLISDLRSLGLMRQASALPMHSSIGRTHTHAPGPTAPRRNGGRTCFTVTTRFTISREQRTEIGDQDQDGPSPVSVTTRGSDARRRPGTSVLCSLSSVICTWWAWADLNGRPHAYQACALTN
jgi:hypothetical protein